jgi:hypothetical protein
MRKAKTRLKTMKTEVIETVHSRFRRKKSIKQFLSAYCVDLEVLQRRQVSQNMRSFWLNSKRSKIKRATLKLSMIM